MYKTLYSRLVVWSALGVMTVAVTQAQVDYFGGFGSFESDSDSTALIFNGGTTAHDIPGWTMISTGALPAWLENGQAQEQDRHILLRARGGADAGDSGARFNFAISPVAFTVGELYELSFWAAGGLAASGNNRLGVFLNGGSFTDFTAPLNLPVATQIDVLDWQPYTLTFTATDPTPQLRLRAEYIAAGGNSSMYLDNFSVRHIPEPGSLLLLGVASTWLLRRRRNGSYTMDAA